jgi:hypothetical protein
VEYHRALSASWDGPAEPARWLKLKELLDQGYRVIVRVPWAPHHFVLATGFFGNDVYDPAAYAINDPALKQYQPRTLAHYGTFTGIRVFGLASAVIPNGTFQSGSLATWTACGGRSVDVAGWLEPGSYAARLCTGSPVSIYQPILTPDCSFSLDFDYQFLTTTGTLDVLLNSVVLASVQAPAVLPDGPSTLSIPVTDPALLGQQDAVLEFRFDGPSGSQVLLTNIVAVAPIDPLPTPSLELDPASDSGIPGDARTADVTPTLRGIASEVPSVAIYIDSLDAPAAIAAVVDGEYSVTLSRLTSGTYTIWAQAIDATGNTSYFSDPLVLTIEACPPLVEGTDGNDTIRLVRNAGYPTKVDVFVNNPGPAPTKTVGIDELWQWIISGGQGNDRLEVDLSLGSLLPVGGLVFDGGEGHDTLVVVGASADDDLRLTTSQVLLAGRPPIDYSRLESFAFRLGTGNDALTVDGTTATLVEPLSAAAVSVVNSGQLQAPSITAETVSVGAGAVLRFASSAAGGGGAQSGLPVDGPGTAASHTFQQQQFAEPAAEAATATTAAADWLGPTIEYAVAAQPPSACAGPVEVPAAVDGAQDIGLLSARGQPTAAAVEAIDAVVADWADQLAAEMLDGASTAQVEVDVAGGKRKSPVGAAAPQPAADGAADWLAA